MNKNSFNKLVRPAITTIPIGQRPSPLTDLNSTPGLSHIVDATVVPPRRRRDSDVETTNFRAP
jgi:hypothetical protein